MAADLLASFGKGVLFLVLLPLILALILLFVVFELLFVWIGPLWHYLASRRDRATILEATLRDKDLKFVTVRGHQLAVRVSRPPPGIQQRVHPVILPNGMAATMAMLGRM
jgi:hypothetical protein